MAHAMTPRLSAGRRPAVPSRKLGTWKMAYADFLTALMAFFLLLWLVSGVSPEDRAEIAAGFRPGEAAATASAQPADPLADEARRVFAALQLSDELAAAGDSVMVAREPDAIRIDLVDSAGRPLFDTASGTLTPAGNALVSAAGRTLAPLQQRVSIEGHTDAFGLTSADYSNWELSAARANEARRLLEAAGVAAGRVRAVTGLADTQPLDPGQPHLARNRRVSLKVHLSAAE